MFSQREAQTHGMGIVFNQHLLLGLVAEDKSPSGFLGSGITIDRAREAVRAIWPDGVAADQATTPSSGSSTGVPFSLNSKRVFQAAVESSKNMGCKFISPEHITIGLLNADDGSVAQVLQSLGTDLSHLASVALSRLHGELAKDGREPVASSQKMPEKSLDRKSASLRSSDKTKEKSPLAQFCVDLTALASEDLIDPVIGRDTEIQRIVQILCRRTKNNPILLGDPGVGKTAIAEGLALRIAKGEIPSFLKEKRIMSLDVGLLMAGAKERGGLESRVTGLISEVQKAGDIILFIDEVHTLIGSGSVGRGNNSSGLDIANLLKPALGRGELQCIASTTLDEHKTHFEKDKALARRFQPVLINEPSQEDAVKILLGLREKYEIHHKCTFTLEAINAAVYLSARYIPDRHLPDKAIDLIDEAGSRAHMDAFKKKKEEQISVLSKSPEEYWREIRAVQAMHEVVNNFTDAQDYVFKSLISVLILQVIVGPEEIATVASLWSGIPVQQLNADERKLLVGLDEELRKREDAMLRLDMSEYMERHTVSKLIGSPPGYIGYGDGGTLTEAVRRRPFTVILLDEIEKAHPDIFNILLQVFEDGHLTDSQGRRVSFKNTLIVMTSNVGSEAISKGKRNIGFLIAEDRESNSYASMKALVMEELKAYFRPELLNRIDEVVVFRSLEQTQMLAILNIMLEQVKSRLSSLGIGLEVSDAIMNLVCEQGFDRNYGARPLRRAVTQIIEDVISEAILAGDYKPGDTLTLDVDSTGNPVVNQLPDQSIHWSDATV
ncbi:hypothetical protein C4D60_Mb06t24430 [Musa balbisiana]|uniref:Clp R domain-containing protein n=1 Tax=Musa balbisiana TaxID=52838 RepID=A0A4V4H458_MUSBA|nr:hypothetical protein C4D60_Mb06t24430 [Musa balbisiana]